MKKESTEPFMEWRLENEDPRIQHHLERYEYHVAKLNFGEATADLIRIAKLYRKQGVGARVKMYYKKAVNLYLAREYYNLIVKFVTIWTQRLFQDPSEKLEMYTYAANQLRAAGRQKEAEKLMRLCRPLHKKLKRKK